MIVRFVSKNFDKQSLLNMFLLFIWIDSGSQACIVLFGIKAGNVARLLSWYVLKKWLLERAVLSDRWPQ